MITTAEKKEYIKREYSCLVGHTIEQVRPLTDEECESFAWNFGSKIAFAIILDDGSVLVPSQDPEGNGPGHIFIQMT